ncbi:hypothetical protein AB0H76_28965 [Nocardia sp. NPDC050712]|uniref:hypothetical protein n=1 Tax=Nocardia sp. NPDC050712 TaxID=3155518 RepID=UPI0033E19D12
MYRNRIDNPIATGRVQWTSGGRRLGAPTGGLYLPTALPGIGPNIRLRAVLLSIYLERTGQISDEGELVQIGFLVPTLAAPHLYPGAEWTVFEGPRPVAELSIKAVLIKTS